MAVRRPRGSIYATETADRNLLRRFLDTDRLYAAYALCDLDDREFLRTRWGVAMAADEPIAVALQYAGYAPQPVFVMGENVWRYEREWPLARTRYTKYYFHSGGRANSLNGDGTLSTEAPSPEEAKDTYTYDPANPVNRQYETTLYDFYGRPKYW